MEPWQKAIVLREARRLETYIRRWRWILLARMRASLADEFGLTPSNRKAQGEVMTTTTRTATLPDGSTVCRTCRQPVVVAGRNPTIRGYLVRCGCGVRPMGVAK